MSKNNTSIWAGIFVSLFILCTPNLSQAQIFGPESLNMPGTWDPGSSFSNPPTTDGLRNPLQSGSGDIVLITDLATDFYRTYLQEGVDISDGAHTFLFTSGNCPGSCYANKWANVIVTMDAIQNYTIGGGTDNSINISAGKWYTVNFQDNGYSNTNAIFMETSAEPVTISSVSQSPTGSAVAVGQATTITVNTSAAPSAEEIFYVRYSTNGFTSSSYVELSFTGSTGTATIPGQTLGTTVDYYIMSTTVTSPSGDVDLQTIRWDNNAGANYSYTAENFVSITTGDWSVGGTWNLGIAPNSSSAIVTIAGGHIVTLDIDAEVQSLTIQGTYEGGSNDLTIASGGTLSNSGGTFNGGSGSVSFAGGATASGTIGFNDANISGGVNFGGASTINGTLSILSGGFVNLNCPAYASGSTLQYNTGGAYGNSIEWNNTPHHLSIIGGTTLTLTASGGPGFNPDGNLTLNGASALVIDGPNGDVTNFNIMTVAGDMTLSGNSTVTVSDNNGEDSECDNTGRYGFSVRGNATINAGSSVTLNNDIGDDFYLGGDLTVNGDFNTNLRAIYFDGSSTQNLSGTAEFDYSVIRNSSGVNQTGPVSVDRTLNLESGIWNTNGFPLTILSTATSTGMINDFSSTCSATPFSGSINGLVTFQRYIPAGPTGFHLIGAPVSDATINGDLSEASPSGSGSIIPLLTCDPDETDPSSPYGNVMRWNETGPFPVSGCNQSGWEVVSSGAMTPNRGYLVNLTGGSTLTIDGAVNTGATLTYSGLSNTNATGDGWHLVSNGYPSPINWNNPTGFDGQAQFWQTSGAYSGTYQAEMGGSGYKIPALQGFMVRVGAGTHDFVLNNTDRAIEHTPTFYSTASFYNDWIDIKVEGNGFADITKIYFREGATNEWDSQFDAHKLPSAGGQPTLYTLNDGLHSSIQGLPILNDAHSIELGLNPGADGEFTFTTENMSTLPLSSWVYLEDKSLGIFQDLNEDPVYTFTANATDDPNRFVIHFIPPVSINSTVRGCDQADASLELDLGSYSLNGELLTWNEVEVLDTEGNIIFQESDAASEVTITNLESGIYELRLIRDSQVIEMDLFIEGLQQVFADFEVSNEEIEAGQEVEFSNTSSGGLNYRWDFGDGSAFVNSASPVHSFELPGTYTIMLEAENADCNDYVSKEYIVSARTTGIEEAISGGFNIYSNGKTIVVNANDKQSDWSRTILRIHNIAGQLLFEEALTGPGTFEYNLTDAADGIYLVSITSSGESVSVKLPLAE